MSPLPSPVALKPEFHLKVRQLKLVGCRRVTQMNLHENGVCVVTRDLDNAPDDVNLDWAEVEQLYISLANALTLRNIRAAAKK